MIFELFEMKNAKVNIYILRIITKKGFEKMLTILDFKVALKKIVKKSVGLNSES